MAPVDREALFDALQSKVRVLNSSVWQQRADWRTVSSWLSQFEENSEVRLDARMNALYLLTHFLYFGASEIRSLLKSLYNDHIRYRLIQEIRRINGGTRDTAAIHAALDNKLRKTRFVSLGNPAESSAMMLYFFRQENDLPKNLFSNAFDLFIIDPTTNVLSALRDPSLETYIFIDDLCGSGDQGKRYASQVVAALKMINPQLKAYYYAVFGVDTGLQAIRDICVFDAVETVIELDRSFKCFDSQSRVYSGRDQIFDVSVAKSIMYSHGERLWPEHPLGYKDGQLAVGFSHNTPDNTLPIFWYDRPHTRWAAVFKRYPKIDWKYGAI